MSTVELCCSQCLIYFLMQCSILALATLLSTLISVACGLDFTFSPYTHHCVGFPQFTHQLDPVMLLLQPHQQ